MTLEAIVTSLQALALEPGARVLDFGCGAQPYRHLFGPGIDYLGADLPGNDRADLLIVNGVVDLPDASVDLVFSTQVLEHVPEPDAYLNECRRVLRPGGRLLLSTHGVMFDHPHPTDFWRWTTDGLDRIMRGASLQPSSITPVLGAVPLGLWLVMLNLQDKLPFGLRHLVASLFNLVIRWSNRVEWSTYRADFVYVVRAERMDSDTRQSTTETPSPGRQASEADG